MNDPQHQQYLQQLMESERTRDLIQQIDTGLAVREFLASELGAKLVKDAEEQRALLVEQLLETNPTDTATVIWLRTEIKAIDYWQQRFALYIQCGEQAEGDLAREDAEKQD